MATLSVLSVTIEQAIMMLFTVTTCQNMYNSQDKPKDLTKEISLRKLVASSGFSEMELLSAFHITQAMEFSADVR
jgi:hypothetical protein